MPFRIPAEGSLSSALRLPLSAAVTACKQHFLLTYWKQHHNLMTLCVQPMLPFTALQSMLAGQPDSAGLLQASLTVQGIGTGSEQRLHAPAAFGRLDLVRVAWADCDDAVCCAEASLTPETSAHHTHHCQAADRLKPVHSNMGAA